MLVICTKGFVVMLKLFLATNWFPIANDSYSVTTDGTDELAPLPHLQAVCLSGRKPGENLPARASHKVIPTRTRVCDFPRPLAGRVEDNAIGTW